MTDRLDDIIRAIQEDPDTELSAEARNALHGALSSHPWCAGKDLLDRCTEVRFSIAGRHVNANLRHAIEKEAASAAATLESELDPDLEGLKPCTS